MQPSQRSARLKQVMEATETVLLSSLTATPSTSRKHQRKRPSASSTAPPPESSSLHIESLSASSDDEGEHFPPKEPRYEASHEIFQARTHEFPHIMRPTRTPVTARYISMGAMERYNTLKPRKFINQQRLSFTEETLLDVKKVVVDLGLIHTVIDSDAFQPIVVREFVANLLDAEDREVGVAVYVKGSLVDFSPSLINSVYCIPGFEEDPNWLDANIDVVCGFLTDNRIRRWENMSSKYLTATNQVLYKLVCSNWIPSMNYTTMNQERLRIVPSDNSDVKFTGFPKLVVKDKKVGRGSGADSSAPNLEEDIASTIARLSAIRIRLRRGEYTQHEQAPHEVDEDEDDGDDDEDSEESASS
ncbi:hypothetical protein F2Q69_00050330 [Brassica cretica]|uniref:Putative plant transposon protein domain-containing protein n=1 Tax=Brassica cretica TaxID=69181 RepID=A0A8S9PMI2_BRACR|nr:hypothetical protein F2Q69_00050330 [Brassica cretica]